MSIPALDRSLIFLMIYSDRSEGESVRFRVFDADAREERAIVEAVAFQADAMVGTVEAPYLLTPRPLGIGDPGYLPDRCLLGQAFPNPFNATTQIGYGLPAEGKVELVIYNFLGQKVRTLVSGVQPAGYRTVTWDGKDQRGRPVATGVYIYVMKAGAFRDVKKLVLLK
jgi:hypothetical protein